MSPCDIVNKIAQTVASIHYKSMKDINITAKKRVFVSNLK